MRSNMKCNIASYYCVSIEDSVFSSNVQERRDFKYRTKLPGKERKKKERKKKERKKERKEMEKRGEKKIKKRKEIKKISHQRQRMKKKEKRKD